MTAPCSIQYKHKYNSQVTIMIYNITILKLARKVNISPYPSQSNKSAIVRRIFEVNLRFLDSIQVGTTDS